MMTDPWRQLRIERAKLALNRAQHPAFQKFWQDLVERLSATIH